MGSPVGCRTSRSCTVTSTSSRACYKCPDDGPQMCSSTTISRIEHLGHRRPGQGHRSTSSFGACLAVHTEDPAGDHPYAVPTRLDPHTPPMLSAAYNRRRCGPIIALRPGELPLTPGTKRQVQAHVRPVIRREIPTKCGFSPFRIRSRAHQDHTNADLTCTVSKWSRLGSNQRPSACEADGKSVPRRLCWSNWTNWTHREGSEHAIWTAWRMRSG
jgi:hypothetical protein